MKKFLALLIVLTAFLATPAQAERFLFVDGVMKFGSPGADFNTLVQDRITQDTGLQQTTSVIGDFDLTIEQAATSSISADGQTVFTSALVQTNPKTNLVFDSGLFWMFDFTIDTNETVVSVAEFGLGGSSQSSGNFPGTTSAHLQFVETTPGVFIDFFKIRESRFGGIVEFDSTFTANSIGYIPEPSSLIMLAAGAGLILTRRKKIA